MFREPTAQQFQQGGILLFFQHDLVQQLLGEKLLLFGRQCQDFGKTFNDHARTIAMDPPGSILNAIARLEPLRLAPVLGQRRLCLTEDFEDRLTVFRGEALELRVLIFPRQDVVQFF